MLRLKSLMFGDVQMAWIPASAGMTKVCRFLWIPTFSPPARRVKERRGMTKVCRFLWIPTFSPPARRVKERRGMTKVCRHSRGGGNPGELINYFFNMQIALVLLFVSMISQSVFAANFDVINLNDAGAGSFRQALLSSNASGTADTITFAAGLNNGTINLVTPLPLIQKAALTLDINAGVAPPAITLNGGGLNSLFFVYTGTVTASNLTLNNGRSLGGNGGTGNGGGGGALGAGGAVFVNNGASMTLVDVDFTGNLAQGGDGGASTGALLAGGGGGGMLGGVGGNATLLNAGAGGGGVGGNGGSSTAAGTAGLVTGAAAGGTGGGAGAGAGGASGGGGGGASAAGGSGAGGGVGGTNGVAGTPAAGGAGGFGGGGGGGSSTAGSNGGASGFGGGGGGAGAGAGSVGGIGTPAIDGGAGGAVGAAGQSGSGLGGAIFVRDGATLVIRSTNSDTNFTGNTVTAGTAGAAGGIAAGQDIYLHTGTTATMDVGAGRTQIQTGSIAGPGGINKTSTGILAMSGDNAYTGLTTITAGTLRTDGINTVPPPGAVATQGAITVATGATFDLNGFSQLMGDLNGGANSFVTLDDATLTLGTAVNSTFAGDISGLGGNLIKQGAGRFLLSGTNFYTGTTTVTAGTLAVSGTLDSDSTLTLNAGTTLEYNGGLITSPVAGSAGTTINVTADSATGNSITGVTNVNVLLGSTFTVNDTISGFTNFTNTGRTILNTGASIIGNITAGGGGSVIDVNGTYSTAGTLAANELNISNGGTLTLNNNVTAATSRVLAGGALVFPSAAVTVTGDLTNSGSINLSAMSQAAAPLAATVTGALSQAPTATLNTTLTSTTSYGRIAATAGAPVFSGNISLSLTDNGTLINNNDLFTIATGLTMPVAPTLVQPTSATLSFVRDTTAPATTYRIRAVRTELDEVNNIPANDGVADALDSIRLQGAQDGLFNILSVLDAQTSQAGLENALAQLLPADVNGGAVYSSMNTPNLVLDKISLRAENLRYGIDSYSNSYAGLGNSAGLGYNAGDEYTYMLGNQPTYGPIVFGNWAKQQAIGGVAGYSYGTGGFGVLADTPTDLFYISPLRLGAGLSYAQSVIKTDNTAGNKIIAGSFQMTAYGLWDYRWIFVDGSAYYGLNNYRSTRNILITNQVASGKYAGLQWGGRIRAGIAVPIYTVNITPMGELQYTHLTLRQYTETGAPGANLTVSGREISAAQAAIGIKAAEISEPAIFIPEIHVWYLNTFKNPSLIQNAFFVAGGPAFSTVGPPLAKTGIDVGGSITAVLTNGSVLNVGYDLEMRNKYTNNIGYLKIRLILMGGYTCCD